MFENFEKEIKLNSLTFPSQKTLKILFPGSWIRKSFIHSLEMVIRHHIVLWISCYIDYLGMAGRGKIAKIALDLYLVIAYTNYVQVGTFHTNEIF